MPLLYGPTIETLSIHIPSKPSTSVGSCHGFVETTLKKPREMCLVTRLFIQVWLHCARVEGFQLERKGETVPRDEKLSDVSHCLPKTAYLRQTAKENITINPGHNQSRPPDQRE